MIKGKKILIKSHVSSWHESGLGRWGRSSVWGGSASGETKDLNLQIKTHITLCYIWIDIRNT